MRLPRLLLRSSLLALLVGIAACGSRAGTNTDIDTDPNPSPQPDAGPSPLECAAEETECDDECVDLMVDTENCGVCGRTCEADRVCEEGQCMTPEAACELENASDPTSNAALCEGDCVDLNHDVNHCGACGGGCPVGDGCLMGTCQGPPAVESCTTRATGMLKTSISDIVLGDARVTTAGLRHAYDVDEVEAQGCVDHFELEAELGDSGCMLKLIFAADEAGAGLIYASMDVDSFCPGFDNAEEGLYERADGWAPTWFGLDQIDNAAASETCVAGDWLSFDDTPLRLLRDDGAELLLDLSAVSFSGWIPSQQDPNGACVPEASCGDAHDGGDGWCLLAGCSRAFHDGGEGSCVPVEQCTPGYVMRRNTCAFIHTETAYNVDPESISGTSLALEGPCRSTGACTAHISYFADGYSNCSFREVGYVEQSGDDWNWSRIDLTRQHYSGYMTDRSSVVDDEGVSHVCYLQWAPGCIDEDEGLMYARLENGTWTTEIIELQPARDTVCSLALDSQGRPHVAYSTFDTMDSAWELIHAYKASGQWLKETVEDGLRDVQSPSLVIDPAQRPHAAYYYADRDLSFGVRYARRVAPIGDGNESAIWEAQHVDGEARVPSLAIDSQGLAHIAYYDHFEEYLKYANGTIDSWEVDVVDPGLYAGVSSSIALSANDVPHIAYADGALGGGGLSLAYRSSGPDEPLEWNMIPVDVRTREMGSFPSLVMDSDDNAHISYTDNSSLDPYGGPELVLYSIVGSARPCPLGSHDGGDGACVPNYTCSEGFWDGGAGPCVPEGECSHGFHDGGDGSICLPLDTCLPGYHDGGAELCVPIGECRFGYHDGGDGVCVRENECSYDYHDRGDGACAPLDECLPGFISEGRDDCERALHSEVYDGELDHAAITVDGAGVVGVTYGTVLRTKAVGGEWEYVGSQILGGFRSLQSSVLDQRLNIHMTYKDTTDALVYGYRGPDATDWETAVLETTGDLRGSSIATDSNNDPRVAFIERDDTLRYASASAGTWTTIEIPGVTPAYGSVVRLSVDSNDSPHVLYKEFGPGTYNFQHVYFGGGAWNVESAYSAPSVSDYSFTAGANGIAHAAFASQGGLEYAVQGSGPGGGWGATTISELRTDAVAVALDQMGRPHLAYVAVDPSQARRYKFMYSVHDGNQWIHVELLSTGTRISGPLEMVVDSEGHPHIVYELGSSDPALRYAYVQKQF